MVFPVGMIIFNCRPRYFVHFKKEERIMKVFITGGTGFIGRHLVRRMAQTEHTIYCLARASSNIGELKKTGAHIIMGDVNDRALLAAGMHGCDWVFHLAGAYSWWSSDKTVYRKVNVDGTRNVMECALENNVSKVVHVSSIVVYGKPDASPLREETAPAQVRSSLYAQTKYEGEQMAWQLFREKKLPLVVVYPCAVLGGGDRKLSGETIHRLTRRQLPARIFSDRIMTYVHVKDVVEAILQAAQKPDNLGEKYIVGNTHLTFDELCELVGDVSGAAPPKLRLPESVVMFGARALTWLADRSKRPPLWGVSLDAMRMLKDGIVADGGKAQRELGITYTSIRQAVDEEVSWAWRWALGKEETVEQPWSGRERRAQTRNKVELSCTVSGFLYGGAVQETGRITDLTGRGMYLKASIGLDEGTEVKTQIKATRFTSAFWIAGRVLRSSENGMGIQFLEYAPREVDMILNTP